MHYFTDRLRLYWNCYITWKIADTKCQSDFKKHWFKCREVKPTDTNSNY